MYTHADKIALNELSDHFLPKGGMLGGGLYII